MSSSQYVYEVRPRKDKRDFDLISDVLPFGGLWYCESTDAIEYAKFYSRTVRAYAREWKIPASSMFLALLRLVRYILTIFLVSRKSNP
jgi:hypothetical protein